MNEQKFQAKCQAIYAYEDEMLAKLTELVKPLNAALGKLGLKAEAHLGWHYDVGEEDEEVAFSRKKLNYRQPYACFLCAAILPIENTFEEEPDELSIIDQVVSQYGVTVFRGWAFSKYKCGKLFAEVAETVEDLKAHGVEYAVEKHGLWNQEEFYVRHDG